MAITAGCAVVEHWASIVIGLTAGTLYLVFSKLLVKWKIDDAVDAIPVHVSVFSRIVHLGEGISSLLCNEFDSSNEIFL